MDIAVFVLLTGSRQAGEKMGANWYGAESGSRISAREEDEVGEPLRFCFIEITR